VRHLVVTSIGGLSVALAVASVALVPLEAQRLLASSGAAAPAIPRTPDGRPDLQGVWDFSTLTPLERPTTLAGKEFLTDADAADFERQAAARRAVADSAPLPPGQVGGYNQFWYEPGSVSTDKRTALIVDPPDGRIPPLTPEAQKRADAHRQRLRQPAAGPEDRDAPERCLLGYNSGPPMTPGGYNQNVQLVQTAQHLVIHNEMVHDARIVPLDDRPRLPSTIRPWLGDSRGRWEGDTLVVDTRNFSDQTWNQFNRWNWASDENMHLVERFTRVDANTLTYEFTVDDPTTWTRPWTAVVRMTMAQGQMYEYACHEANYGMFGILRGARLGESAKAPATSNGVR
jgi:hypothetical protein